MLPYEKVLTLMETSSVGKTNPDDVINIFIILDLSVLERKAGFSNQNCSVTEHHYVSAGLLHGFKWDVASTLTKLEMPF